MSLPVELPEQEIVDVYKKNVYWTVSRLAKKYKTTTYQINKLLKKHNALRETTKLEVEIIKRFLKYEAQNDVKRFAVERFNARRLIEKCPNEQFWMGLDLPFKLNSLAWFLSVDGTTLLKQKYANFRFEIPVVVQHNMGTEKVGEDAVVDTAKPLTIHDFLKR